jgi:hypothetical protein
MNAFTFLTLFCSSLSFCLLFHGCSLYTTRISKFIRVYRNLWVVHPAVHNNVAVTPPVIEVVPAEDAPAESVKAKKKKNEVGEEIVAKHEGKAKKKVNKEKAKQKKEDKDRYATLLFLI